MKIRFLQSLAIVVAAVAGSSAFGEDCYQICDTSVETVSFLGGGGDKGCYDDCGKGGDCCGIGGGAYVDVEALFFRHSNDIDTAAPGNNTPEFAHELAPRISVGYVGCGGLGIRFRYFDFSHDAGGFNQGDANVLVDTYNMDVELFEEIEIGCATSIEWSAGIRYNDYKVRGQVVGVAVAQERFAGWGATFGLQANRCIGPGNFYGRARWAILQDENSTQRQGTAMLPANPTFLYVDDMRMQTEIAIGYEVSRCTCFGVVTGRIGYEMQFWENYGTNFAAAGVPNFGFQRHLDSGFDGIVLGLELAR